MEYTTLGRTGLKVSVAGLGCGGFSRIGQGTGKTEAESIAVVRAALDAGVTFFDTAEEYHTEELLGKALKGVPRDQVVISTKGFSRVGKEPRDPVLVVGSLNASLKRLGVDYVDVYHLHGVTPELYEHSLNNVVPALLKEKEKGKFRHLGITEIPPLDPNQTMLQRAVQADCWDVMMAAYHMMHQGCRAKVFPAMQEKGIGLLNMFAVRVLFSQPGRLQTVMQELAAAGKVPAELAARENPLDFLLTDGGARSIIDAAYRFCRHEPGTDVILFGTGSVDHLQSNIDSILSPPLREADVAQLHALFGELTGVGLDRPGTSAPA
jgi:aryl-alcohol dehydrogenase-like predicted oxidoreductase